MQTLEDSWQLFKPHRSASSVAPALSQPHAPMQSLSTHLILLVVCKNHPSSHCAGVLVNAVQDVGRFGAEL